MTKRLPQSLLTAAELGYAENETCEFGRNSDLECCASSGKFARKDGSVEKCCQGEAECTRVFMEGHPVMRPLLDLERGTTTPTSTPPTVEGQGHSVRTYINQGGHPVIRNHIYTRVSLPDLERGTTTTPPTSTSSVEGTVTGMLAAYEKCFGEVRVDVECIKKISADLGELTGTVDSAEQDAEQMQQSLEGTDRAVQSLEQDAELMAQKATAQDVERVKQDLESTKQDLERGQKDLLNSSKFADKEPSSEEN